MYSGRQDTGLMPRPGRSSMPRGIPNGGPRQQQPAMSMSASPQNAPFYQSVNVPYATQMPIPAQNIMPTVGYPPVIHQVFVPNYFPQNPYAYQPSAQQQNPNIIHQATSMPANTQQMQNIPQRPPSASGMVQMGQMPHTQPVAPVNAYPQQQQIQLLPPQMQVPQQTPMQAPPQQPRQKKILAIIDPNTNQVTNEAAINAAVMTSSVGAGEIFNERQPQPATVQEFTVPQPVRNHSPALSHTDNDPGDIKNVFKQLVQQKIHDTGSHETPTAESVKAHSEPHSEPQLNGEIKPANPLPDSQHEYQEVEVIVDRSEENISEGSADSVDIPVTIETPASSAAEPVTEPNVEIVPLAASELSSPTPCPTTSGAPQETLDTTEQLLEQTNVEEKDDKIQTLIEDENKPRSPDPSLQPKSDEELMPPPCLPLNPSNPLENKENSEPKLERPASLKAGSKSMSAAPSRQYNYKEDPTTPLNPEAKRVYDRDFLMSLQYVEPSKQKPEGLPILADILQNGPNISNDSKGRDYSGGGGNRNNFFQRQSSSTKRQISQSGSRRQIEKPQAPQISYQRADVKLNKVENAWKPGDKVPTENMSEEDKTHEALLKSFRGILNKITPQKFESLLEQVLKLPVKTEKDLKGIMNLVFEKAIDEPGFSVTYATLCQKIAKDFKVPSEANASEEVNFRKLLLCQCQKEYEKSNDDDQETTRRKEAISQASSEEKPRLEEEYALFVQKARRRKLGNIRFIGELFKLKMLVPKIMHDCIVQLLKSSEEEDLECLCRLLTTIGEELDTDQARQRTSQYFTEMGRIVSGSSNKKVSSRIKFALQDVIDLRENNWKPRRENNNPKTIKQIHAEAALEAHETKMLVDKVIPSRGSMKGNPMPSRDRQARGSEEGWNQVGKSQRIEPSKLKLTKQFGEGEVQLGPSKGFGTGSSWGRGSSGSGKNTPPQQEERPSTPNKYAALERDVYDTRSSSSQRAPVNRGSLNRAPAGRGRADRLSITPRGSMEKERSSAVDLVRQISRPGSSRGPSRDSSIEGRSLRASAPSSSASLSKQSGKQLNRDEWDLKIRSIIDELLHNTDIKESVACIADLGPQAECYLIAECSINYVIERSSSTRQLIGELLTALIQEDLLPIDMYVKGLSSILEIGDDLAIDIPNIWDYLKEIIKPSLTVASKEILEIPGIERVPSLSIDPGSSQGLTNPADDLQDLKNTRLETKSNEEIVTWIEDMMSSKKISDLDIISVLTYALVKSSIDKNGKLNEELLKQRFPVLVRYYDSKPDRELAALSTLENLMDELQHPAELLSSICYVLAEQEIITDESFQSWVESSNNGIAIKSISHFIVWLNQGENQ